jgi:SAM-dependent methyltransferase
MASTLKEHWNMVYLSNPEDQLGWYEAIPQISLEMIDHCSLAKNDPILDVGSGATLLVDYLINQCYTNLYALDFSEVALEKMRLRLGKEKLCNVRILVDDITAPVAVINLKNIALWHDRALLHFLTEDHQQKTYRSALEKVLRPGGHVIIAAFARDGADKCSGLDVLRHDETSLSDLLGDAFELKESLRYQYQMLSGAIRPYIYVRLKRRDQMERQ